METELNKLIDKIKIEGIAKAEESAESIRKEAEDKARRIVTRAEIEAQEIINKADRRALDFQAISEKALKQSARDVLLTLRERVTEFFDRIVKEKVSSELTPAALKEVIIKAAEGFGKSGELDIEVLVSEEDKDKIKKALFGEFKKEAKKHFTIKGSKGIDKGFRIGKTGKDSYVDFTDEAIAEALKKYLNPKLVELLDIDLEMGKG
jgi:V/A-type H+-transporting ATPase subunit E